MKIAVDGAAFQQGIAGGILSTSVGLLNAIIEIDQSVEIFLVTDPRIGPVNGNLLSQLNFTPKILEFSVGAAYKTYTNKLITKDPETGFEVDGSRYPAKIIDGELIYTGPAPNEYCAIYSRAGRPCDVSNSHDRRQLGIAVKNITISGNDRFIAIDQRDDRLDLGFHASEGDMRWTNGRAVLKAHLFPPGKGQIELRVEVAQTIAYTRCEGALDASIAALNGKMEELSLSLERLKLERELIRCGVSVYIVNHFLPFSLKKISTMSILYDMIPVIHPAFFDHDALENFEKNVEVFRNAKHVFAISECSRRDAISHAEVNAGKISVIPLDVSPVFVRSSESRIAQVRRDLCLSARPYILSVGTLEPRKNHALLIDAFHNVIKTSRASVDLVIVGKRGWGTNELVQKVLSLGLHNRVHFIQTATNEDLAALYSGALFLAYPSRYEGFGLPIIEAMACGCPVLTSTTSSMPEVAGGAASLVDPTDISSVERGIYTMIHKGALRDGLSALGYVRRQHFNWGRAAQHIMSVISEHK